MFVRTRRLTLRPGWIEDAPELARTIARWEVVKNLSNVPWPYTLAHAEAFLSQADRPASEGLMIVAPDDFGSAIIGCIGLRRIRAGQWELGYWLVPEAWGKGYATEAGRAMLDYAKAVLGLDAIGAGYHLDNGASAKVLTKLGFTPTGEVRSIPSMARGEPVETVRMRLMLDRDRPEEPARIAA